MPAQSTYELRYKDFSDEESSVKFTSEQLDGANYNANMVLAHDLRAATDNITIGARILETVVSERLASVQPAVTDKSAQRERKWLVRYHDDSQFLDAPTNTVPNTGYGKVFTLEIPTADQALLPAGNRDTVKPTDTDLNAAIGTWITAFEAFQRSPYNGNVEVDSLTLVGRNL